MIDEYYLNHARRVLNAHRADPDTVGEGMRSDLRQDRSTPPAEVALQKALDDADWVEDAKAAAVFSQTHVRKATHPPAWLRCEFMREGQRCIKGEGHHKSPEARKAAHEEPSL